MKRLFVLITLLISFGLALANMGVPYREGSTHTAIYGNNHCTVTKEKINIDIYNRGVDESRLYAVFRILYYINSDQNQDLPLLFIGKDLLETKKIKVNQKTIATELLDSLSILSYPFITQDHQSSIYHAQYTADDKIPVSLNELIYFNAPLHKGENTVYIEYEADLVFSVYGFLDNFQINYSLYPSRFWKSFGPIELALNLNNMAELTDSNLGKPIIQKGTAVWQIDHIDKDIALVINYKSNWFAKMLLYVGPEGIALLASLIMFWLHFRWMHSSKRPNLVKWFGIFLVPLFTMIIYLLAYPLIDYVLDQQSKHGYVFLIVLFYPLAVLCYLVLVSLANLIFRKK